MESKGVIEKLEALYQELMTKDLTPDEESQAKVQLLEILSSIKAHTEIQGGVKAKIVLDQTNSLKDLLLEWDPYGSAWFKEEKTLVNSIYNLLAAVKTLSIQKTIAVDSINSDSLNKKIDNIASSLKSEISNLQDEIAKIKKHVVAIATAIKERLSSQPSLQISSPAPSQTPEQIAKQHPMSFGQKPEQISAESIKSGDRSLSIPVPIPDIDSKNIASKPISLPKPVPLPQEENFKSHPQPFQRTVSKPIPIPKPEPIKESSPKPVSLNQSNQRSIDIQESSTGPEPIPLIDSSIPASIPRSEPNFEEPALLDEKKEENKAKAQLFGALTSSKKDIKQKPSKEELFNLFSSGSAESFGAENEFEQELEIIEEPLISSSQTPTPSSRIFPQRSEENLDSKSDPGNLYQELITLEGKRYSIERSIRDLKSDRENGVISDHEYKEKLSLLLNKLQGISKRIGTIREKLD